MTRNVPRGPENLRHAGAYKAKTPLTARQRFALEQVAAHQPIPSVELGALLHEERALRGGSGHTAGEACDWCATEGRNMGKALRAKGLVRERRGAGWVLVGFKGSTRIVGCYDPASSPWPEGF